jgi:endonuclease/exonuclease/phosphatase family metal-dependent hydrolase
MTSILTYNILLGGTQRTEKLAKIIESTHPDIIGLIEATNPLVVEELAQRLGMRFIMSGRGKHSRDWQIAVLSRLPILGAKIHTYPKVLGRRHMLEVTVEETSGNQLTVFAIHLTSNFYNKTSCTRRRNEIQLALSLMAPRRGQPHLLLGDFNSIAPGEPVYGCKLLRYLLIERDNYYQHTAAFSLHKHYSSIESLLRAYPLRPFIRFALTNRYLAALIDLIGASHAEGGIDLLQRAGYVDCYRHSNPYALGFTCPSPALSGRIDYIFASPDLAERLIYSDVIGEGNGVCGEEASDHLPVIAEFHS